MPAVRSAAESRRLDRYRAGLDLSAPPTDARAKFGIEAVRDPLGRHDLGFR
jgi:hypothetical protein